MDWLASPFLLSILGTLGVSVSLFPMRPALAWTSGGRGSYLVIPSRSNSGIIHSVPRSLADRHSYMAMLGLGDCGCCCSVRRTGQTTSRPRPAAMRDHSCARPVCTGLGLILMNTRPMPDLAGHEDLVDPCPPLLGRPQPGCAHYNMGYYLFRRGNIEAATAHYTCVAARSRRHRHSQQPGESSWPTRGSMRVRRATQYAEVFLRSDLPPMLSHTSTWESTCSARKGHSAATHYAEAFYGLILGPSTHTTTWGGLVPPEEVCAGGVSLS